MARARNIKPAFFENEVLGTADPMLSLLFIGLWMLADREGRLEDRPLRIKGQIFPHRDLPEFNGYLTVLERMGFIERYEVGDFKLIQVVKFKKHQHVHHTERESTLPGKNHMEQQVNKGAESLTVKAPLPTRYTPSDILNTEILNTDTNLIADTSPPSVASPSVPEGPDAAVAKNRNGVPYQKIVDLYHECLPSNPRCEILTAARKGYIAARWNSGKLPDLENWQGYFTYCSKSKFLTGQVDPAPGRKRFVANLEWLTKESNFVKIFEGKYHG